MSNPNQDVVSYRIENQIGIIELNYPPVNALSHPLRTGLIDAVNNAQTDASKALVIICKGRTFIAGADITEFSTGPKDPQIHHMLDALEASKKLIVAAIHGTALGGGLETALCCHYRCALRSAKVGLPEVKLGILPGAGGTQRLPRLTGVIPALEIMTKGNPISAEKAAELNVIDRLIDTDQDLLSAAISYSQELIADNAELKKVSDIVIDPATAPAMIFEQARMMANKQAKGLLAPQKNY